MPSGPFTLMVVHAHPDDESSSTGGLLRLAAVQGHTTVLVTCTNGELGEVNDPSLRLNPKGSLEDRRHLAEIRRRELKQAATLLGVTHLHMLGYHDSGMQGWKTNHAPEAFVMADLEKVTARLAHLVRRYRPEVVVTYDSNGGYGHPDHVMAHRVTMSAVEWAANPSAFRTLEPPWQIRKLYYTAWARSEMLRTFKFMRLLGMSTPLRDPNFNPNSIGCPDELITTRIDIRPVIRIKWRALFAHRSQMGGSITFQCFLRLTGRWLYPYESFRCVYRPHKTKEIERDIFSGL